MKIVFISCFFTFTALLYGCGSAASSQKSSANTSSARPTDVVLKEPAALVNYSGRDSLTPVLAQAKLENKPVFLDFYATWCTPCKLMDETVFMDKELAEYLNRHLLNMKVNAEVGNGINLGSIFNVSAFPTMVFLDANGNELVRKQGSCSTTDFRKMAEEAVGKMKNK